jgi:hypothetical protein
MSDEIAYQKVKALKALCHGSKQQSLERAKQQYPDLIEVLTNLTAYTNLPECEYSNGSSQEQGHARP